MLWTWWDVEEDIHRLIQYCMQDVLVESEVDAVAPQLSTYLRAIWILDQRINDRGIKFDIRLILRAQRIVEYAKELLDARIRALTDGKVQKASQTRALSTWINDDQHIPCTTIRKGAQDELLLLAEVIDAPKVIEAIEIRRAVSKTSTAKLWAISDCLCDDNRARGLLHFHGAHTGRFTARLVQPHNFYRIDEMRDGPDVARVLAILDRDLEPKEAYELIAMIVGEVMEAIAKCMRSFVIAEHGCRFVGADLSSIETRVGGWVADEAHILQAFRAQDADPKNRKYDLYRISYGRSFNIDPVDVTDLQRQIGKVQILSGFYQGSVGAYYTMSQTYLLKLDTLIPLVRASSTSYTWDKALWLYDITPAMRRYDLSRDVWAGIKIIVDNFRAAHPAVCQSWWDQQDAAIEAVARPGTVVPCCNGKLKYCVARGFLWCQLPSGRLLAYCHPRLTRKDDSILILQDGTRVEADEYTDVEINALVKLPGVEYKQRIRSQITYEGYIGEKKRWGTHALYGGLQAENNVSGIAYDILVGGMLRAESAGYPVILTVHDELLTEPPVDFGSPEELRNLMVQGESWSAGLPLAAVAWEGMRY